MTTVTNEVLEERIANLNNDRDRLEAELTKLRERLTVVDRWLAAGMIFFVALFGTGAWFGSVYMGLKKDADALETKQKNLGSAIDVMAQSSVFKMLGETKFITRLADIEEKTKSTGQIARTVDSARVGGANPVDILSVCEKGEVIQGLKLTLGGTCGSTCNNDGRPVSAMQTICVKQ